VEGIDVEGELAFVSVPIANIELGADCLTAIGRLVINIASLFFAAKDGLIYANVHTLANPAGEVRGQLLTAEESDQIPPSLLSQ
jgi:hypothetical protein